MKRFRFAQPRIRRTLSTCLLLASLTAGTALAQDELDRTITLDIAPHTSLEEALIEFGLKAGLAVMINTPTVEQRTTAGLHGTLHARDALEQLLRNTGLSYSVQDGRIRIVPSTGYIHSRQRASARDVFVDTAEGQAGPTVLSNVAGASSDSSEDSDRWRKEPLPEVIVTAEKREESSLDVPISLTALSGEDLERTQARRFEDFVGTVPGLTYIDNSALGSQLVLRGIVGGVNAAVATYVDETPYTAVGPFSGSQYITPNLDTFDMQRIEVLRGPQGTVYGASALGGLLKYVTNAPDPSHFSVTAEGGVSSVKHGGTGDEVHGMINIPIGSDLAFRVVGYDVYYPGYIDDPSRGVTDINGSRFTGGRASLLYQPESNFSVRVTAYYQDRSWNDYNNGEDVAYGTLQPLYGDLTQERLIPQPGHATTEIYNGTLNWQLDLGTLVSTTSYARYRPSSIWDSTAQFGGLVSFVEGAPAGAAILFQRPENALTQEIRFSSAAEKPLQWQVGGYFTNQNEYELETFLPISLATNLVDYSQPTNILQGSLDSHYREYAGFVNLDYHIVSNFDVGVGGRYSRNEQRFHETTVGVENLGIFTESSENVFTYSTDLRWHFVPKSMLYLRVANGFIPGGPNDIIPTATGLPQTFSSSKATNYEVGVKSQLFDGHVTAELTAFAIEWKDIQLNATIDGFGTITNGGTARSEGFEWNFEYAPIRNLTLGFNGAYTDARLTQDTPASVGGLSGNHLPFVALWETSTTVDYRQPLAGKLIGSLGADWRFVGNRPTDFASVGDNQVMPKFHILNLRAGLDYDRWSLSLYVKNVADRRAINNVSALADPNGPQSAIVYTPRTIGAAVTAGF